MDRLIKKVIITNPNIKYYDLRLILKDVAKHELSDIYFKKFEDRYGIENIGSLVFGQHNDWKGLITIWKIVKDDVIEIGYDKSKLDSITNIDENKIEDFIIEVLKKAEERGFIGILN